MLEAIKAYSKSIGFLRKHGLTWFLWFPLVITALVFFAGFKLTSLSTDLIMNELSAFIQGLDMFGDLTSVVNEVLYWLLWILLRILLYFAFAFLGGSVILLLMAPVLTWLSEKVAQKVGTNPPPFSLTQFIRDLTRALALALKNGLFQLLLTIGCFIIGFIPVVGIAAPFLLFGINAYFYGYNFMDYTLERKRLSVRESNRLVWSNKFTTLSLGTPFALWMLVPFIGPMTGGFMAMFATIASTLVLEKSDENTSSI